MLRDLQLGTRFPRTHPTVPGPFVLRPQESEQVPSGRGLTILIANGGGCDFPMLARSYSLNASAADGWRRHTLEMTQASVVAAAALTSAPDEIQVFSCLSADEHARILALPGCPPSVRISYPSLEYYDVLRRADIVVARAGAGAIADASVSPGELILWPLPDHDEQERSASEAASTRPNTQICRSPADIADCVRIAVSRSRAHDRAAGRIGAESGVERAAAAILTRMRTNA